MGKIKKAEKGQERLKIDLKEVSGIQFDPGDKEINSRVVNELNYINGIISYLWENHDLLVKVYGDPENDVGIPADFSFGADLVYGWVSERLKAISDHIYSIVQRGREVSGAEG